METLDIVGEALKLTLGRHWLLEEQLDTLKSLPFVVELATKDLVVEFSVLPRIVPQVFKHFIWAQILGRDLLCIKQSLLDSQHLLLVEVDHLRELPLLLGELSILLLLLPQFAGRLEERLKVILVALILEKVDLRQQLVLLLLELRDLLFELGGIHALLAHLVDILMRGLELCLQVLVSLIRLLHFFINEELVRNRNWDQELSCVGPSLQFRQFCNEPMQDMLNGLLLAVDDIALEGGVEVAGVAEDF